MSFGTLLVYRLTTNLLVLMVIALVLWTKYDQGQFHAWIIQSAAMH